VRNFQVPSFVKNSEEILKILENTLFPRTLGNHFAREQFYVPIENSFLISYLCNDR